MGLGGSGVRPGAGEGLAQGGVAQWGDAQVAVAVYDWATLQDTGPDGGMAYYQVGVGLTRTLTPAPTLTLTLALSPNRSPNRNPNGNPNASPSPKPKCCQAEALLRCAALGEAASFEAEI